MNLRGLSKNGEANVRIRINGLDAGKFPVGPDRFELTAPIFERTSSSQHVHEILRKHTIVELEYLFAGSTGSDRKCETNWGIASARLS